MKRRIYLTFGLTALVVLAREAVWFYCSWRAGKLLLALAAELAAKSLVHFQ